METLRDRPPAPRRLWPTVPQEHRVSVKRSVLFNLDLKNGGLDEAHNGLPLITAARGRCADIDRLCRISQASRREAAMKLRMAFVPALTAIVATSGLLAASPAGASMRTPRTAPATAPVIVRPTPWRVVYANRTAQPILRAIAALSSRNIWAIGDRRTGPFSVHWNGRHWTTATIPHATGFTPLFISAPSAADVWVLGFLRNGNPSALRWDGVSWHSVALPADGSDLGVVFSPSDIWLAGGQSCGPAGCMAAV